MTTPNYLPIIASDILAVVIAEYDIHPLHFVGTGRHPRVLAAREAAVFLCRKYTVMSYPEIARAMGMPTHTTAIWQHKRAKKKHAANPEIYAEIERKLLAGRVAA